VQTSGDDREEHHFCQLTIDEIWRTSDLLSNKKDLVDLRGRHQARSFLEIGYTTLKGRLIPGISYLDKRLRSNVYPSDMSRWRCFRQRRGRMRPSLTSGIEKARVVVSELLISFTTICPSLCHNVYLMLMYYVSASCFLFSLPCSVTLWDESLPRKRN
jgi:hypothetical protein